MGPDFRAVLVWLVPVGGGGEWRLKVGKFLTGSDKLRIEAITAKGVLSYQFFPIAHDLHTGQRFICMRGYYMALSYADFLAGVIAFWSTHFGGFHRLAINNCSARHWLQTTSLPIFLVQSFMDGVPDARFAPFVIMIINSLPWRKFRRDPTPLAT